MTSTSLVIVFAMIMAPSLAQSTVLQPSNRALLATATDLTTGPAALAGRKLLCFAGNCVRPLSAVQQHKTPVAPKSGRKSYDLKFPKRALLAADTDLVSESAFEGGRKLLCFAGNCVRPLSAVQQHKTPVAPKSSRKSYDLKFPKRALLAVESELEAMVDGGRRLLCYAGNCVRPLSKVQQHKNPVAPKDFRKSYSQTFPKRALLATNTDVESGVLEHTRA